MKFWTNRIATNSNGDFSKLIEKVAASRQQTIKTAAVKQADATEPANTNDVEIRKNVHGIEGSPNDQNGEAEEDGEKKVVEPKGLSSSSEEPLKEAQMAAPAAKPAVRPQAKPGMKPQGSPVQAKPVMKPQPKPGVAPVAKPAAPAVAGKPSNVISKPSIAPKAVAKPVAPAAKAVASPAKPGIPGVARPVAKPVARPASPALANADASVKVADAPALGNGEGDGEELEGVTKGRFPEPDREQMYKQEPEEDGTAKTNKESAAQLRFEKVANLTPKAKAWLNRYWKMIHPAGFADAMTQDK